MKLVIFLLLILGTKFANGQMNFQDSSVQVISFWNLGEKYEYSVSYQKLKYEKKDTTSNETLTYDVDVSVIDSTENSYTVRWFYKNFKSDSENPIFQKIVKVAEEIAVDVKLDELGVIQSVENWEEVRDYMAKSLDSLKSGLPKIPAIDKMFQQLQGMYSSKESIEAMAIQDVQQFHNFHGGKFRLNDLVTSHLTTPNVYNPHKPFDTDLTVILEELDEESNQYRIRSINEVNSEQLTETTYNYLNDMFKDTEQKMPKREEFKNLILIVETVSRIHNTGWVLESVMWKEILSDEITTKEIRIIQMK